MELEGQPVELVDTAGRQEARDVIEEQAQQAGRVVLEEADLVLWCQEAGLSTSPPRPAQGDARNAVPVVIVATKCDLRPSEGTGHSTSAVTGAGLDALRTKIAERARSRRQSALAPSLSRCRHHVDACLRHLRLAHAVVLNEDPPEILALELRGAVAQLGEMTGTVYTEDLLDRIFSRFCIGK
jgi:tRNA modification GTPase